MQEAQPLTIPASANVTGQKRTRGQVLKERRRKQQIMANITVVKTGFGEFCTDPNIATLLEEALPYFSQTAVEGALFRNFDVLRRCEAGIPLDKIDLTYFNQSLIAIGPTGLGNRSCKASDDLKESLRLYKEHRPLNYVELEEKKPFMGKMLEEEANKDLRL